MHRLQRDRNWSDSRPGAGSCSTGAAWRPVEAQWEGRFRCVTTSLLGYGRTIERRTDGDTAISHEAEIIEARDPARGLPGASCRPLVRRPFRTRGCAERARVVAEHDHRRGAGAEILRHMGEHRHYLAFAR